METRAFDAAMIAKSIPDLLAYLDKIGRAHV